MTDTGSFSGFPPEGLQFMADLAKNNNWVWALLATIHYIHPEHNRFHQQSL